MALAKLKLLVMENKNVRFLLSWKTLVDIEYQINITSTLATVKMNINTHSL